MGLTKQLKNSGILLFGQLFIKGSSFLKQLILAFYLGISAQVDLLLIAQIIPSILISILSGGAGEILVTTQQKNKTYNERFLALFIFGEKLMGQKLHFLTGFLVFLGSWISGWFILATNAWMQHPVGHEVLENGRFVLENFSALFSNPWLLPVLGNFIII